VVGAAHAAGHADGARIICPGEERHGRRRVSLRIGEAEQVSRSHELGEAASLRHGVVDSVRVGAGTLGGGGHGHGDALGRWATGAGKEAFSVLKAWKAGRLDGTVFFFSLFCIFPHDIRIAMASVEINLQLCLKKIDLVIRSVILCLSKKYI
jgi:hypothetical protein